MGKKRITFCIQNVYNRGFLILFSQSDLSMISIDFYLFSVSDFNKKTAICNIRGQKCPLPKTAIKMLYINIIFYTFIVLKFLTCTLIITTKYYFIFRI